MTSDNQQNPMESLDPEIRHRLEILRDVPGRDRRKASQGRARFLYQAQEMRQAVSQSGRARHKGWIAIPLFRKKEPVRMSTLAAVLVILSLVFGGSTATIAAAQTAMPDQPLYHLKLISEDVGEKLAFQNQTQFELALQFASRRLAELEKLMLKGETPPEDLMARYQNRMQNALRLAAEMPEEDFTAALLRLQETLRQQEQIMLRLHEFQPDSPLVNQLMAMIQTRLQMTANGLQDPLEFRNQVRSGQTEEFTPPMGEGFTPGDGQKNGGPGEVEPPGPGNSYGGGNENPWTGESPEPGAGFGQDGGNPWTNDTPTPGSGYGYGDGNGENPWTSDTPTPGSGYGDGSGGNPWTSGTPTPGSGYGPGPK